MDWETKWYNVHKIRVLKEMRGNWKTGQLVQLWQKKKKTSNWITSRISRTQKIMNIVGIWLDCLKPVVKRKVWKATEGWKAILLTHRKTVLRVTADFLSETMLNIDGKTKSAEYLKGKGKNKKASLAKFYIHQKYYSLWGENKDIFTHRNDERILVSKKKKWK